MARAGVVGVRLVAVDSIDSASRTWVQRITVGHNPGFHAPWLHRNDGPRGLVARAHRIRRIKRLSCGSCANCVSLVSPDAREKGGQTGASYLHRDHWVHAEGSK